MRFWIRLRSARSGILVQSSSGFALALKALLVACECLVVVVVTAEKVCACA